MNKIYTKYLVYLATLTISACNSGTNSSTTNKAIPSSAVEKGGVYKAGAAMTKLNYFNNELYKKRQLNTQVDSFTPVGWNSQTNSIAPVNCWDYSASQALSSSGNTKSLGNTQSAQQFEDSMSIDASISASFSIFSASNDLSYSSMKSTDNNTTSAFSSEITRYKVMFAINGLNRFGQSILNSDPQHFDSICGDSVLMTIPVKLQSGVNLLFTSSKSSATSEFADKVSAGIPFASIGTEVSNAQKSSNATTKVRLNQFTFGDPALFAPLSDNGLSYLATCLTTGAAKDCDGFLIEFDRTYSSAISNAENHFNQSNGTNWAGIYATDDSNYKSDLIVQSNTKYLNAVQQKQLSGVIHEDYLKPYLTAIKSNINLLSDLDVIRSIFNTIWMVNPSWKATSTMDYSTVMYDYNNAIQSAYNSLHTNLGKCIYAKESSGAVQSCSSLYANNTVNNLILSALKPQTKQFRLAEHMALDATIDYMIYDVSLHGSNNSGSLPQKLLVLPNDTNNTTVTFTSLDYLNDGISPSFGLLSQPKIDSMNVVHKLWSYGESDPVSNSIFTGFFGAASSNVTKSVLQNGVANSASCLLFGSNSQACIWSFNYNNQILSIKDNSVQRVFKTLYPFDSVKRDTFLYVGTNNGIVQCLINDLGETKQCSTFGRSDFNFSGGKIVLNKSARKLYAFDQKGFLTICNIESSGNLSICDRTNSPQVSANSAFIDGIAINSSNTILYYSDEENGIVRKCGVNPDGSLVDCSIQNTVGVNNVTSISINPSNTAIYLNSDDDIQPGGFVCKLDTNGTIASCVVNKDLGLLKTDTNTYAGVEFNNHGMNTYCYVPMSNGVAKCNIDMQDNGFNNCSIMSNTTSWAISSGVIGSIALNQLGTYSYVLQNFELRFCSLNQVGDFIGCKTLPSQSFGVDAFGVYGSVVISE